MKIKRYTEGDSRTAKSVPTFSRFMMANESHIRDVAGLMKEFCDILKDYSQNHDYTKILEPFRSMFYRDLCDTIQGRMNFEDGEWARSHYARERHHLTKRCPEDVNLFDVIEMICDCVAAGMARTGDVYEVTIPNEVLQKAVLNTVEILKNQIELVD